VCVNNLLHVWEQELHSSSRYTEMLLIHCEIGTWASRKRERKSHCHII